MKEFPRIFGMRPVPSLAPGIYIISPQMCLFCTKQFKVFVASESYYVVTLTRVV
jgi:hypothetical protein